MEGQGKYIWPNGKKYEGQYKNDKKEGYGIYTWPDGRQYSGMWKNGKQDGVGRFKGKNGIVKSGMWEDGKRVKWIAVINADGTQTKVDENGPGEDDADVPVSVVPAKKQSTSKKSGASKQGTVI